MTAIFVIFFIVTDFLFSTKYLKMCNYLYLYIYCNPFIRTWKKYFFHFGFCGCVTFIGCKPKQLTTNHSDLLICADPCGVRKQLQHQSFLRTDTKRVKIGLKKKGLLKKYLSSDRCSSTKNARIISKSDHTQPERKKKILAHYKMY